MDKPPGIFVKKDPSRSFRISPAIPPKPVGLVSQTDTICLTATTSRGIDPEKIPLPRANARPAYSVPTEDPEEIPPPTVVFPDYSIPYVHNDLEVNDFPTRHEVSDAPIASISETDQESLRSMREITDNERAQANMYQEPPIEEMGPVQSEKISEELDLPSRTSLSKKAIIISLFNMFKSSAISGERITYPQESSFSRKKPFNWCTVILGLLFVIFFLACIGIFIGWAVSSHGFSNLGGLAEVCSTKECIDQAFRISTSVDESIPPCENFYRYTCGKFHGQPIDKQAHFIQQLEDNTLTDLYNIVNAINLDENCSKSTRFAKELFNACMNFSTRQDVNGHPFIELLRNLPCGSIFSECKNFNSNHYSWERHVGMVDWYAADYNLVVFGREIVGEQDRTIRLSFRPPNLDTFMAPIKESLLSRSRLTETEFETLLSVELRQDLLSEMVSRQLMTDPYSGDRKKMIVEISELMVEIDNATKRVTPSRDIMSLGDFFNVIPQINMTDMLNAELSSYVGWSLSDTVVVYDVQFFEQLAMIVARNPKRSIANYLTMVTAIHLKQYLFNGTDPEHNSWRSCAFQVSPLDPFAKLYADSKFNISLQDVRQFTLRLRDDFMYTHRNSPIQVINSMSRVLVGYPQRIISEEMINAPFIEVQLNTSDYFYSITRSLKAQKNGRLSQIGAQLHADDSTEFEVLRPTLIHSKNENSIVVPLSALQEPISVPSTQVPKLSIYGSYGVVFHQLLAKVMWQEINNYSPSTCIEEIYRSFLNNAPQYPNLTEPLMDTIVLTDAVKTASYAYQKWQKESGIDHEQNLPLFTKMSSMGELFVTFGTMYCNYAGFQSGSNYEAMINTVIASTSLYTKAMKCEKESAMYSRARCYQPFIEE